MTAEPRSAARPTPALLSHGFRPFFLFGALYAGLVMLGWLVLLETGIAGPVLLPGRDWHVHELVYGYLAAVIAGFLLTAIPNWTGRLPIRGRSLAALVALWLAGRVGINSSAWIGLRAAAAIDLLFLVCLTLVIAREILAGRNWRNVKVLALSSADELSPASRAISRMSRACSGPEAACGGA